MKRGRRAMRSSLLGALAALVILAAVVSGCSAQAGIESRVEEDGSGQVSVRMSMDKGLTETLAEQLPDLGLTNPVFDDLAGRFAGDWEVTSGTGEDGGPWLEASHGFTDPEEYEQLVTQNRVLSSVFDPGTLSLTQERQLFKTTTVFRSEADASAAAGELQDGLGPVDLGGTIAVEHRLTLPGEVTSTNADEVEGGTLTWDLGDGGSTSMMAESVVYRWGVISVVAGAGVFLLVALAGLAAWILVRRRRGSLALAADGPVGQADADRSGPPAAPEPSGPGGLPVPGAAAIPLPPAPVPELPAPEQRLLTPAEDPPPADDSSS